MSLFSQNGYSALLWGDAAPLVFKDWISYSNHLCWGNSTVKNTYLTIREQLCRSWWPSWRWRCSASTSLFARWASWRRPSGCWAAGRAARSLATQSCCRDKKPNPMILSDSISLSPHILQFKFWCARWRKTHDPNTLSMRYKRQAIRDIGKFKEVLWDRP